MLWTAEPTMEVWIVDDVEANRMVVLRTALAAGWTAREFPSGRAALAAQAGLDGSRRPAVVLLDFDLGEERGDRVCRAWRAAETAPAIAILVGYSSSAACSEAIVLAGGDLVLPKRADGRGLNAALLAFLRTFPPADDRPLVDKPV